MKPNSIFNSHEELPAIAIYGACSDAFFSGDGRLIETRLD